MIQARLRVDVRGAVQGVGFRPLVYQLALEEGLCGWVRNEPHGAGLEIQGNPHTLDRFLARLRAELPFPGKIASLSTRSVPLTDDHGFTIAESPLSSGQREAGILPDLAPCSDCLEELADQGDRRHAYPFINCTHCGPRFSIITGLPYDRPFTTMSGFAMCAACWQEYQDPTDRRFHAQPIACPVCGPRLSQPLEEAARAIGEGGIVAVKGVGGFQLLAHPGRPDTLRRLRQLKGRPHKPLALMVRDLGQLREICEASPEEIDLLRSPAAPIVLLQRHPQGDPADDLVAPGQARLGVMLCSSPLHHLLLAAVDGPVVATSGNRGGEPLALTGEPMTELADLVLDHDRPIARPVDDSLVAWMGGAPRVLRRARGLAPAPLDLPFQLARPLLAVGGHQKVTVTLGYGSQAMTSQHLGDMDSLANRQLLERTIVDLCELLGVQPDTVAHDLHPDYFTTIWAERSGKTMLGVQHHHAHLAAALCEFGLPGQALGIIWDGTGYGPDGTVWGGEFLLGDLAGFRRVGRLRRFSLPGGELASRQPARCASGLLAGLGRPSPHPAGLGPLTSSMGRLFDGVASILGFEGPCSYEGQAASFLENLAQPGDHSAYPMPFQGEELDWGPTVEALLREQQRPRGAARFHASLVQGAVSVALAVGCPRVVLSGGCFQNRRLLEGLQSALVREGFEVLVPSRLPCNDGGLSLGQLAVAAQILTCCTISAQ